MTVDSIRNLLEGFAPLDRVTIIGGEPLLHPNFPQIQTIFGNAAVTEKRLDSNLIDISKLDITHAQNSGIRVCVSLDGHIEEIHSILRGPNVFSRTVRNLKNLIAKGIDIEVTHTVHAKNINLIGEFIAFCRAMGIKRLNFHKISPRGNAIGRDDLLLRPFQWVELVELLRKMGEAAFDGRKKMQVRFETLYATREQEIRLRTSGKYYDLAKRSFYSHHQGGRLVFFPDGKIYISSEAFGSDSYIAKIIDGEVQWNESDWNELKLSEKGDVRITDLNSRAEIDPLFPSILSVSYRESHLI